MKANLLRLSVLLLLAGCATKPSQQQQQVQEVQQEQQPVQEAPQAPAAPSAGPDCASVQPWTQASKALGRPVVQSTGVQGKPIYAIKSVSYAEIVNDRELIQGVKLTDPRGREPAPTTIFNIVWTPEDVTTESSSPGDSQAGCTVRYSAPTFFDMN